MTSHQISRWSVLFSGTVQGVGFRFTTVRVAEALGVCGFVRNLKDCRVELVVETDRSTLEELIDEVCRTTHGNVTGHTIESQTAKREFRKFEVRF